MSCMTNLTEIGYYCLTILAADGVYVSFHTVSESTPMPPQGNKQNRDDNDSEKKKTPRFQQHCVQLGYHYKSY